MADIKISELEPTTDLEGLYTIGADKNNLSKKVSLQFLKDAANYANEQGDYAKQAGDTVNGNVGVSDYPEFSASKSYVIGDIVRYNGVLYSFTANHAASAWNGSDVKATSINAITSEKLTELESETIAIESKLNSKAYYDLGYGLTLRSQSIGTFQEGTLVSISIPKAWSVDGIDSNKGYTLLGCIYVENGVEHEVFAMAKDGKEFSKMFFRFRAKANIEYIIRYRGAANEVISFVVSSLGGGTSVEKQISDSIFPLCKGFGESVILQGKGESVNSYVIQYNSINEHIYVAIGNSWNLPDGMNPSYLCFGISETIGGKENDIFVIQSGDIDNVRNSVVSFVTKENAIYTLKIRAMVGESAELYVLFSDKLNELGNALKKANNVSYEGYRIGDGGVLIADSKSSVSDYIYVPGNSTFLWTYGAAIPNSHMAVYDESKKFVDTWKMSDGVSREGNLGRVARYVRITINNDYYVKTSFSINGIVEYTPISPLLNRNMAEQSYDSIKEDNRLILSDYFKTCNRAWVDKDNQYESWPYGGVLSDGESITIAYNSRVSHVDKKTSDIYIRKKFAFEGWHLKKMIKEHTDELSFGNPSICKLANGNYLICVYVQSENWSYPEDVGKYLIMESTDKGETWEDVGYVKVDGLDVVSECMMSLFCSSTGRIFAFSGSSYDGYHSRYIMSEDNGRTWEFIGSEFAVGVEEAGFVENEDGEIYSIVRKNESNPALVKISADGSRIDLLYDFNEFKFPAYFNPTSMLRLRNGKIMLLACSRSRGNETTYPIIQAVVTDAELLSNSIHWETIGKYDAESYMDYGYMDVCETNSGILYAYFYGGEMRGQAQIYEIIGKES